MGCVYSILYDVLWISGDTGFHVGYLGFAGMFFFLFSSYYGAIDSLADGGEPALRTYCILAGGAAIVHFAVSVCGVALLHKGWWLLVLIVPMSGTLYFAVKHLLIPDVEMGIIRVLRPYNALICVLCVGMMLFVLTGGISGLYTACSVVCAVLLIVSMIAARNGVRKWYI
ncbi:MAG: permease [Peptococcaceae bacterium]|nr:permease [Peptococcaceae bacterium]